MRLFDALSRSVVVFASMIRYALPRHTALRARYFAAFTPPAPRCRADTPYCCHSSAYALTAPPSLLPDADAVFAATPMLPRRDYIDADATPDMLRARRYGLLLR